MIRSYSAEIAACHAMGQNDELPSNGLFSFTQDATFVYSGSCSAIGRSIGAFACDGLM